MRSRALGRSAHFGASFFGCEHPVDAEGLVERAGRMGRQIVEHHANALGPGIVDVGELVHASGEVLSLPKTISARSNDVVLTKSA